MPTTATPQPGTPVDPYRAYTFKLLINGVTNGHFTEVSGLEVTIRTLRYREAGNDHTRTVPGQADYTPVTLRYGLTSSRVLWDWVNAIAKGTVTRRNVSIVLLDPTGTTEVMRWNLINAWPTQWRGAHLNTLAQEIAVEALTLAYDGLDRE
ncbi:phage tail protein [Micromonospora sp. WMMA1363]|uniref:phage tail protein n=1 Tax=Micromonospora sp. WMMA1363 TaxID=3053985 RepID=UPI00259CED65|nr:phage tail protein [Micromonospora sp. WMMA1363]MDM4722263.1 phage tail protein [Micromonospora sp. WMMA1363]